MLAKKTFKNILYLVQTFFFWWGIAGENLLSPSLVATFPWFAPSIVVFTPCPVHIFYPSARFKEA